jgi:hypothetical protein
MKKKERLLLRRGSGAALVLFGLLCLFNIVSPARMLATVIYPQYFWYQLYPDSEDSANPTLISAGSTITVNIKLVYYDATADVELPSPTYWIVKVAITRMSDNTIVKVIDFGLRDDVQGGVQVESHIVSIAIWEEPWTVPTGMGELYKFAWTVHIKDSSGNDYGTQTKTTYAKTADIEPDGVFKINGKDASQTSSIVVLDPTLTLEFAPSRNADKITAVKVEVWKGGSQTATVTLTKQADGNYKGSYTLPGYGVYELKGYIEWSGGSPLRKMSLIVGWGEEGGGWFGLNQIIGLVCMAVGAVLIAKR